MAKHTMFDGQLTLFDLEPQKHLAGTSLTKQELTDKLARLEQVDIFRCDKGDELWMLSPERDVMMCVIFRAVYGKTTEDGALTYYDQEWKVEKHAFSTLRLSRNWTFWKEPRWKG